MKFKDYKYERCEVEEVKAKVIDLFETLKSSKNYKMFKDTFDGIGNIFSRVETMASLGRTRYTINTEDKFYSEENEYWDENMPLFESLSSQFNKIVLDSKFIEELKQDVPHTYILKAEFSLRAFDDKIVEDLQNENKLTSSYQKLIASAQIPFEGETYTLVGLGSKMEDTNRDRRKAALKAYWGWMEEHETEIDTIYDKLVHVRDGIAKKLGFKNFVELGYIRMFRFDYTEKDVASYRKKVLKDVVPVANKLYARQKERLGLDVFACYDEKFEFASGNPTPKYNKDEMVLKAQTMYRELSKETGEFFDFMIEKDLMDLESKKGKAGGGYCTLFPDYKSPFIFSNFNGTSGDVDVLTHEAGHAFQVFNSMDIKPTECIWPTYESCEIHSMSMEFFAWPWMKNFFEEDVEKYYFLHLGSSVKFIPYGILVDHFQHVVYENPNMTPNERKKAFRDLEKQYLPHKNYDECDILEKGCWWFKQAHIFMDPFYYVDYTLAQVCALQFWLRLYKKDPTAFKDYYAICKVGGTLTFTEIVKKANLKIPFVEGCLEEVMKSIDEYLKSIDDKKM